MQLKYKKLDPDVPDLIRHSKGAGGFDLYTTIDIEQHCGVIRIPTGVAVEIPVGYVGLLTLRSSMGVYMKMLAGIGIIDSDYRGEIQFPVELSQYFPLKLNKYTRIGQIVIVPCIMDTEFLLYEELSATERGSNGFGSTGQ